MSPSSIGWLMSRVWPASIFSPDRPERVIRVHRGEATCIDQTKASAEGEQPEVVDCKVTDASSSASSATTIAAARAPQLLQPAAVEYNEVAEGDADEWHAAGLRKKHGRDSSSMRLSPDRHKRAKTGREIIRSLHLEPQTTISYNNNCLAFSMMIGSGMIASTKRAQFQAKAQSDEQRRLTHVEIMSHLPETTPTPGENGQWWAGYTRAALDKIFTGFKFMGEAHLHGFATRFKRVIVVIDVRNYNATTFSKYEPGYSACAQSLSLREATELRQKCSPQPIWVLLEHLHFSALLLETTDVALDGTAADGTATEGINIGGGGPFGGGTATGLGFGSGFGADCRPIGVGFPVVGAATLTLADGTATQGINIGGGGPVSSGGPFGGGTATGLGFGSGGGGAC